MTQRLGAVVQSLCGRGTTCIQTLLCCASEEVAIRLSLAHEIAGFCVIVHRKSETVTHHESCTMCGQVLSILEHADGCKYLHSFVRDLRGTWLL